MNVFSFPFRYLRLRDERQAFLHRRNLIAISLIASTLSAPFWILDANYFGSGGFLDRFSSFSGVLTGFYVAALVGVASFASARRGMDSVIENGPVIDPIGDEGAPEHLTRRQYVSALFGYLAFLSLLFSLLAIVLLSISPATKNVVASFSADWHWVSSVGHGALLLALNVMIAHLVATTCHGLYYLVDRIYEEKGTINPKGPKAGGSS